MNGRVSFIGAGPGAADLLTLRAVRRIAEADVVLWAPSILEADCVREHASADAELVDFSRVSQDEVIEVYRRAAVKRLKVVRLHAGDTALWGAVQEQYDICRKMGFDVEIVPGVATFSAAAAIVGKELTATENAQSMIMTRVDGSSADLPDAERIRAFAQHGTTMAISLSAARTNQLVEELLEGGYSEDTPVVVAYKTTWPDELTVQTTVGELERVVKQHKLWRHALFLVGKALRNGSRSYTSTSSAPATTSYRRSGRPTRTLTPVTELPAPEPAPTAEPEQPRQPQPGSDVAWWAVRDWQETTRATSRTARRYRTARLTGTTVKAVAASKVTRHPDQVTLPVDLTPAPEPEPTNGAAVEPADGAPVEPVNGTSAEPTNGAVVEETKPKRKVTTKIADKPASEKTDRVEKAKAPAKTTKGRSTSARKTKRSSKSG